MSEPSRPDLYAGVAEVLGPYRAETLMAQLPGFEPAEIVTKSDLAEFRDRLASADQRLDRLILAGMFAIVATMLDVALSIG